MSEFDSSTFEKLMHRHYAAIGEATAVWAAFEHTIQLAIWRLAGLDPQKGACITTQIGTSIRLMDALIALVHLNGAGDKKLKALRSFQETVGKHQRTRNRLVHDPWVFRLPDGSPFRYELSATRTLVDTLIPQSTNELSGFIKTIGELVEQLDRILS